MYHKKPYTSICILKTSNNLSRLLGAIFLGGISGGLSSGSALLVLLVLGLELSVKRHAGPHPGKDNTSEEDTDVRGGVVEGTAKNDEGLLNGSTTRLADEVTHDINGGLTLSLHDGVKGNVGHLLARVEEGVLAGAREDVLKGTNEDGGIKRGDAEGSKGTLEDIAGKDEGEEKDGSDKEDSGSGKGSDTPAELAKDNTTNHHHTEGEDTGGLTESTHESRKLSRIRVLSLELSLPGNLNKVDADTEGNNHGSHIKNVRTGSKELKRVADGHLLLVLLLLLGTGHLVSRNGGHARDDKVLKSPVETADAGTAEDDHAHEAVEGNTPAINTGRKIILDDGEVLNSTTGNDEGDIGTHTEERVELTSLLDSHDLIGSTPEKERDDDGTPDLSHHEETNIGPVTEESNGTGEALRKLAGEKIADSVGLEALLVRVDNKGEKTEEDDEGKKDSIEKLLTAEPAGKSRVVKGEANGDRKVKNLQERDNLGTGTRGGNNKDILAATKNSVVEKNAEEHKTERDDLGPSEGSNTKKMLLLSRLGGIAGRTGNDRANVLLNSRLGNHLGKSSLNEARLAADRGLDAIESLHRADPGTKNGGGFALKGGARGHNGLLEKETHRYKFVVNEPETINKYKVTSSRKCVLHV
mmetsp:Transcript_21158/g.37787  ORF Transcript_21158/g.37787 Transcript_21158/m.37787 type:complete len:640 (-) Transcript_21158:698-2617(-)